MSGGARARLVAWLCGLGALASTSRGLAAVDAAAASASATGASAKVKPRSERQLGAVARPTVKKKSEAAAALRTLAVLIQKVRFAQSNDNAI